MKTKAVADVVFCFDCTGSMKPVIDNVKAYVNKFVEGLNADQSTIIDWRMRAMGYGDLEKVKSHRTRMSLFLMSHRSSHR